MQHWRSYTKQEATALEEHYLKGYQKEGLVGKGRPPANEAMHRAPFPTTPAGIARIRLAEENKEKAYGLVVQGCKTVREVADVMGRSYTPVRRYFCKLEEEGRIERTNQKIDNNDVWRVA